MWNQQLSLGKGFGSDERPKKVSPSGSTDTNGSGLLPLHSTIVGGRPVPIPTVLALSRVDGLKAFHRVEATLAPWNGESTDGPTFTLSLLPDLTLRRTLERFLKGDRHGPSDVTGFEVTFRIPPELGT